MARNQSYKGSIDLIGGLQPKNDGAFPLLDAHDVQVGEDGTRLDEALRNLPSGSGGVSQTTVYCWGDSLTQGIGGNVNGWHLMSYPQVLAQRVNAVNLGIMSDDVPTIQARQGSDPVVLPGFTLPASSQEKVALDAVADGLPTRSGKTAKLLRYGDAGLNPCWVNGVKCYLSRDYKADTTDGTTYYIRRAEDGQAVDIPAGTELETFAARHYRGNGIHIFWMGANGGYGMSETGLEFGGYIKRLQECVDFAGVNNYFIIYARERKGYAQDEEGEIQQLIATFGAEHVIQLVPALVERGLLYAETNVWDGTLVNGVPSVLDSGDGCHYSFYGYQAIAGIVWEHIAPYVSQGNEEDTPAPDVPTGDDFGAWAYKLRKPISLTSSSAPFYTTFQPFREPRQQWTIAVKIKDFAPAIEGETAVIVWAEANSETVNARCSAYIEKAHTATDPMCMLGSGSFRVDPAGFTLSEDGCHYLTLVRNANQWGAWLDGNWVYGMWLNYDIGDITSSDQLMLGHINGGWKAAGSIEDVRIYDTAFDDDAVKQLYQAMRTDGSSSTLSLDTTLTLSGAAADAKAVGDRLTQKLDVNLGAQNSGKVLGIDESGQVMPVDAPTSSGGTSSGGGLPTVYCWGDSLTEGVGGWVDTLDNVQKAIVSAYPDVVAKTYPCVNLGCRGETIQTIMARQGADPMVVGGITIPASASENVVVGYLRGGYYDENRLGLSTKSGDVAQPLKECEAGINPCVIAGVEGTLYRDMTADSEGRYAYRFCRLEDGEAVTVPEGTEVETYAMRHYRNGVAVIWMGANGAVNSHTTYIDKVKQMVAYGNYSNYLLVIAREYTSQWVLEDSNSIRAAMTDGDGVCHLLYLPPELVRRGYTLAGIAASAGAVDTSGWTTTDLIKKNAPLLMYTPGGTAESNFETLHFSAYGYKAIGKLVAEKLGQLIGVSSGMGGSGGGTVTPPVDPGYVKDGTDEWCDYAFKLTRPKNGLGSVFNTGVQLYEVDKDWTIACRFADDVVVSDGSLGSVFELRQYFAEDSKQTAAYLRLLPQTDGTVKYSFAGGFGGFDFPLDNAPGYVEPTDGYHTAVIAKQGGNYEFYLDGGKAYNSALGYQVAAEHLTEEPLYLFGRVENGKTRSTVTGKIADFRVYKEYMSPTTVAALVAEMNG